jgi:aspartate/methionine/tyrosine aminotransferase
MQISEFKLERYFAAHEFNVAYMLSASDPESLTLRELLALADPETRSLWEGLALGYTESQGHPLLRREISGAYRSIGADEVLVAVPEEAIFLAMQVLLRPGDHVVALAPAYQSLHEVARAIGCPVTPWYLRLDEGGWRLDLDALSAALTPQTRLIVVNFPHNPTGYLPSREEYLTLVELAQRRGIYLFSDEMYRGLEYDTSRQLPAACDLYEQAVTLSGLSKSYALPGLRIGWLATRDREVLASCARWKDYTTICAGAPSEVLAIVALRARERILARNLDLIRGNLAHVAAFMGRHMDVFTWLPPAAGSVAFPAFDPRWPVSPFCDGIRARAGVLLAPAGVFDYPGNHFRIGLGRANCVEALERVEAALPEVLSGLSAGPDATTGGRDCGGA